MFHRRLIGPILNEHITFLQEHIVRFDTLQILNQRFIGKKRCQAFQFSDCQVMVLLCDRIEHFPDELNSHAVVRRHRTRGATHNDHQGNDDATHERRGIPYPAP